MVAFHYPPYEGGSGVHRTLKFSRYLPDHGWQPIVLSAHPRAYTQLGEEQIEEIPSDVIVKRAFALDTARHLSLGGRYLRFMALPDQWASWWWHGVFTGLKLVRKYRPNIIWSTYPVATAHLIGLTLHRLTGLPWVADFRDSMTEANYPRDPWARQSYLWIERRVVKYAHHLVFTAPLTRQMYLQRYPNLNANSCVLIPNGYDEDDFAGIETSPRNGDTERGVIRLVHAGLIYTDDRDPTTFFRVIARLKKAAVITAQKLLIDLRASGSETYYQKLLFVLDICDIVPLLPPLPHREAMKDCALADALLIFQAASCNHQIPAKTYEYLRLGKPILGLTPKESDTGRLLDEGKGATIVDLTDEETMFQVLPKFIAAVAAHSHPLPDPEYAHRYSRRFQTSQLAAVLAERLDIN